MKSIRLLLNSAIDYAGLFPPASLGMNDAIGEYAECRAGAFSWALGRFIVPASRLAEFGEGLDPAGWQLSVLGGSDPSSDRERVLDFQQHFAAASVEAIEWKLSNSGEIDAVLGAFPDIPVYFEISTRDDFPGLIEAVAGRQARAKVRTGGVTSGVFPPPAQLARFILLCASAGVPFKATAGLHHPVRSVHPLTYSPQSPSGMMHGFLNVLAASAAAYAGSGAEAIEAILSEEESGAFRFDDAGMSWRKLRIPATQLEEMRERLFVSFGSCSFREPVAGMKGLGIL